LFTTPRLSANMSSYKTNTESHRIEMENEISKLLPNEYESMNLKLMFRVLRFNGDEFNNTAIYDELSLSNSQSNVLNQLLLASAKLKAQTMADFTRSLEKKGFEIAPQTLRRIFSELRKKHILKEEPLFHEGEQLKNAAIFYFGPIAEAVAHNDKIVLDKLSSKPNAKRKADMDSQAVALSKRNLLPSDSRLDKKHLPKGAVFSDGIVPAEIERISPSRATGKRHVAHTFRTRGGKGKFHLEAAAPDQVATKSAIATFLVTINLAIAYNSKMITQEKFKTAFEESEVPAHILDIISLRGMKDSGQARKRIRQQIEWLRSTIYKATDLKGIFNDNNLEKIFQQTDYQFYTQISSNADEAPKIVNNKSVVSPNLFFLTFNKHIETVLKEQKLFFSLPWELMGADTIVLFLYIHFRRNRIEDEVIVLDVLREQMYYESDTKTLDETLTKELTKSNLHTPDEEADFNLYGYYMTRSIDPDGGIQYRVRCNNEEMVRKSGAQNPEKLGSSPTVYNQLYATKSTSEIREALRDDMAFTEFHKTYITHDTQRAKLFRKVMTSSGEYAITHYDDNSYRQKIVTIVATELGCSEGYAENLLTSLAGKVQPISYGDMTISQDLYDEFIQYLKDNGVRVISNFAILDRARNYRKKKVELWYNRMFDHLLEDFQ